MKRKEFKLPEELLDRLQAQAIKEYTKDSEIIRRALILYLDQQGVK